MTTKVLSLTVHPVAQLSHSLVHEKIKNLIVVAKIETIVIYIISGIKAILQDSSVKIADDEGVSPSSFVITQVACNML
jgi:hypothetical protein